MLECVRSNCDLRQYGQGNCWKSAFKYHSQFATANLYREIWNEERETSISVCKELDLPGLLAELCTRIGFDPDDQRVQALVEVHYAPVRRELSWLPSIIVAAYPTRGLDLGTRMFLHEQFRNLRRKSAAVLLISADLEEILELSDRVLALHEGEARGPFDLKELTERRLGLLMTGLSSD